MWVVIEIPAWTRTKQSWQDGRLTEEFRSPLPSLFNYGAAVGTVAADGCPEDVVVLGPRLAAGTRLEVHPIGTVAFWDEGVPDHKTVAAVQPRTLRFSEKVALWIFFATYAAYKRLRGRRCRFGGVRGLR